MAQRNIHKLHYMSRKLTDVARCLQLTQWLYQTSCRQSPLLCQHRWQISAVSRQKTLILANSHCI